MRKGIAPALLLSVFGLLVGASSYNNSVTVDESAHLPLGLCYLRTGNPAYALMHGPLAEVLAALGLSLSDARCEIQAPQTDLDFWRTAYAFFEQNPTHYLHLFRLGRIPILVLALLLGLLVFAWTRKRRDRLTAILALFLFAFGPNLIAHAGLATTDLAVTAFSFASVAALWFYLQRPSWPRLALAGAALGGALLSKYTAGLLVLLVPILLAFGASKDQPRLPRPFLLRRAPATILATLGLGLIAWLVLLLGYSWDHCFEPLSAFTFKSGWWQGLQAALPGWLPLPFPRQLIEGLDLQSFDIARPWPIYLLGRLSTRGSRYYQLVVLLYKLPLSLIIILALGLLSLILHKILAKKPGAQTFWSGNLWWTLFPAAAWVAALSFLGSSQFGVRLLIPAIPFLQLFAADTLAAMLGSTGIPFRKRSTGILARSTGILACALLTWYAASTLLAFPFYISYFNELAGGPFNPHRGHEILLDSNLDWDQDWLRFARAQEQNHWEPLHYAQFGVIEPEAYGVKGEPLGCEPVEGYVAISVNLVHGMDPIHRQGLCYTWLSFRQPLAKMDSSIWVFHFGPSAR